MVVVKRQLEISVPIVPHWVTFRYRRLVGRDTGRQAHVFGVVVVETQAVDEVAKRRKRAMYGEVVVCLTGVQIEDGGRVIRYRNVRVVQVGVEQSRHEWREVEREAGK